MLLSPDFFNSLNENFIQTDGCWAWSTEDVYSIGYKELLVQPINLNSVSLDYFRFKTPTTEIIIRYGTTSGSPLIFQGISYNINEFEDTKSHNELLGLQGGDISGNYYHLSASTFGYLSGVSADIQGQINSKVDFSIISAGLMEPTGFPRINNTTISFNNSTRTFNISGSNPWDIYYRGTKYTKTSDSIVIPNLSGLHFIYYTSAGVLETSQTPWDILTTVQVAIVYWDGIRAIYFAEERHGTIMDGMTHKYNHLANWTKFINGFNATYTLTNDSSAYFGVANGMIADEDLFLSISQGSSGNYLTQQINFPGYFPVYYREGVDGNGTWKKDAATIYPYKGTPGGYANYNSLTGGVWGQTQLTVGNYGAWFIYATNNMWEPIICVQSQRNDTSLLDSQTYNTPSSLRFDDLPFQEAKLLYRIIVRTNASYTGNPFKIRIEEVTDYRSDTAIINAAAGGTGTVTSVALTAPSDFVVAGSPITLAGTLALTYANQNSATFLAGPTSGTATTPSFRRITSADLPSLSNQYLPLSGGTLTGLLKGTNISASGNISAINFVGNLNGYKNVENGNETTIANGYVATGNLYINYRGATSAINQYRFWNGRAGSGDYSSILASAFIKNGGTSTQFLKADGSSDSNAYTTVSTTSAISGNLQSQITNNNSKLSAYLPLSGGTLTGQLIVKSNVSASGDVIGSRHIILGGLSSQFLKADGSIDSNSYALDTLGSYYLPLSGGVLTGEMSTQNVRPNAPYFYDLGSIFFPYASLYVSAINASKINMEGSIIPIYSLSYDLGSDSFKWNKIYTKDITSVAMSTIMDRNVEAVDVKSHILLGFDNQLAPHLNFSNSLGTSATLSGDFYFDGSFLKIRDKNLVLKTLAYTSDLASYTPTSGFSQTISAYLPLSGGQLTGQLRGTTISASGNITATNFVGNLEGYKNVDNSNETIIANGYTNSSGELFVNYRGATSAINVYNFCNGKGSTLSQIKAGGAILTNNLKISAASEGWSEGVKVMVASGSWGGLRLTRSSSTASFEDNWAIGYANNNSGNLEFDVYTGGSQNKHTIFYKNGNVLHSGNLLFGQAGNGVSRGLSGDIGSSESWEFFGKSSTTGAGDVKINLYTSSVTQMVPFYITQYSGVTQQNSVTLMDASGNTGLNNLTVQKVTSNVTGGIGFEQSNSKISDTTISADNFSVGSSLIVQNTARTADKIKVSDNLVQIRNGASDAFVQLSASFVGTSGTFLNVSTANPSYPAILTSDIGLMTSGFGIRGKTTYLKGEAPIIYTSAASTTKIEQLCQIMHDMGFIRYI